MAQCASGTPNRFITLTVNPRIGESPADRLLLLARAWRVTVQRLRRRYVGHTIDYFAIVEETKNGEPHLHILFRGPFIPQAYLSACMGEIIDSPIVDIRQIKGAREVIRYVAKYVTKAPHHFGTGKRYWSTQDWEEPADSKKDPSAEGLPGWQVVRESMIALVWAWIHEGYAGTSDGADGVTMRPLERPPPFERGNHELPVRRTKVQGDSLPGARRLAGY